VSVFVTLPESAVRPEPEPVTVTAPAQPFIPAQAKGPAQASGAADDTVTGNAPAATCHVCHAPCEYRSTVAHMRWYACTGCGVEAPGVALWVRDVRRGITG
jgi:hypothetical protein